ncbi:MAG: 50S ribosomal protein L11 methyltransferase [Defluviitaleaceae bacterium]|nr:50S ribosomal protein L11 methyltransferase [Defluviitaleaceae bacterium]
MEWTKVKIECEASNIEIICGILLAHGIEGVEIIDPQENLRFLNEGEIYNWDYVEDELLEQNTDAPTQIQFFLPVCDAPLNKSLQGISIALGELGKLSMEVVEDDWSEKWLEFYKPFKVGKSIVVRPFWEEYAPKDDEVIFTIDPGHVFGTGQHQSTSLCIQLLEKHIGCGEKMLDIGCGSGILSIISLLLGANHATAVDIDPQATKMTLINAEHNNIPPHRIDTLCGNVLADEGFVHRLSHASYHLITANIVADVIIKLAPIVAKLLVQEGKFIVGGIIDDRAGEVAEALQAAGFKIIETMTRDNWVAYASIFHK